MEAFMAGRANAPGRLKRIIFGVLGTLAFAFCALAVVVTALG
ncbi:hypothetical protein Val02_52810 [Virgisporangium aliadipatigenens]|uniref:Uncharacterized protein n=1 Tax=Virgisporangium aliadipatigenens TaxID=741659 RepID=A0A8J3YR34_9ACTN|nr:hypothetical protein [Virgisporangium aliadipatigenens]GIJ48395.1 hypothetical protein Val02_52810 [Virgisporangium aliadipatigenens]